MPPPDPASVSNSRADKRHRSPSYERRQARRQARRLLTRSRPRPASATTLAHGQATEQLAVELDSLFARKQHARHEMREELRAHGYQPWEDEQFHGRTTHFENKETPTVTAARASTTHGGNDARVSHHR